ncbi:hypothetical protein JNUCC0626_13230 [Lentzea sp. JNUCC 0626]|uniref:hypothetical protein n=1 Tax=Lentzea sp. JNUCC 0626 TaxID=3367513 RepID=UPI00374A411A
MVVVLLDDVLPLDYAIPIHVFGREAPEAYDLVTVTIGGGPVRVAGGTTVTPDGGLELLRRARTVVVPDTPTRGCDHVGEDISPAVLRESRPFTAGLAA